MRIHQVIGKDFPALDPALDLRKKNRPIPKIEWITSHGSPFFSPHFLWGIPGMPHAFFSGHTIKSQRFGSHHFAKDPPRNGPEEPPEENHHCFIGKPSISMGKIQSPNHFGQFFVRPCGIWNASSFMSAVSAVRIIILGLDLNGVGYCLERLLWQKSKLNHNKPSPKITMSCNHSQMVGSWHWV